ncbi:MAG: heparan-alpha-glucosaminide N-acetyltransferase domain-containing protein [Verrucomicrobiota bacterium]
MPRTLDVKPLSAAPIHEPSTPVVRPRFDSIDLLRGFIMVLMALDHTRDYFTNAKFDPLDLTHTTTALFLTRWITHFCAPNFIFLAGVGAFLTRTRGKCVRDLSWFLFSRGLWLALLEVTWVRCGWEFNFDYHHVGVGVLWAIGWSMVILAGLVFLPVPLVAAIGVAIIALHNLLDSIRPDAFGAWGILWGIAHVSRPFQLTPSFEFGVGYPIVPWVGVIAAGYGFGSIMLWEPERRRRAMLWLGLSLVVLFVAVRGLNGYGNPTTEQLGRNLPNGQWSVQKNALGTVFSFVDVHKYPPSLDYVLMTVGPALVLLSVLERGRWLARLFRPLIAFGRVPLFYYLLHIPLIHGLAVLVAWARHGQADWLFVNPFGGPGPEPPANAGFDLPGVYLIWGCVVILLYPACRWFAEFKRHRKDAWLSYL